MPLAAHRGQRRWFAPEVVQTSAMDCGPASLKCLLEGFRIPVSYGRLREACQTDVDGTSIDTIEDVANKLGVRAEQVMIPFDHVFAEVMPILPAVVVVRHSDGPTHFVVAWRKIGNWLQVMDPSTGRRWIDVRRFNEEIFQHEMSIAAADWRAWAASDEFLLPLRARLTKLGNDEGAISALLRQAQDDEGWFSFGALDASARLVNVVVEARGVNHGDEALRLLASLFRQTCESTYDIFQIIPPNYWSVSPDPESVDAGRQRLILRGAVLLRLFGPPRGIVHEHEKDDGERPPLSPELAAALNERSPSPLGALWGFLKADGILAPLTLIGAMAIATSATLIEALLVRGIFDIGSLLNLGTQRLAAVLGLLAFMLFGLSIQIPIISETLRFGRHLDVRLRMALLRKLPNLTDRYFQSRPISDMADRGHMLHVTRSLPGKGIHFLQSLAELSLTLLGIAFIDPRSGLMALPVAILAVAVPAAFQPTVVERDLRVRNHSAALTGFYLDALLGLIPIRAHQAQPAVRHQHESLLVEWARSNRRLIRMAITADGIQSVCCFGVACALLVEHFLRSNGVTGADLLLVYWTLKLPGAGNSLTSLAHQYPMYRNVMLRLLEPLNAPEQLVQSAVEAAAEAAPAMPVPKVGTHIQIESGSLIAGGHTILNGINLHVRPGEHIAVVGVSGAGKSSLIGLLLGWHRLASGRLLVDGAPLTEERLWQLRRHTAWVDPAVQLWNRTLLDNLSYSTDAPDLSRMSAALASADLRGLLQKLPDGFQTLLGEGGALLSGGEGQRVRLGRAFLQSDVQLALLDEPFRGLDREQRSSLLAGARKRWQNATLLCVTHDVSETLSFDRVLVIEHGIILEDDAPALLAARSSRFAELLEAERQVRDKLWKGTQWRRMKVQDGRVEAAGAPPASVTHLRHRFAKGAQQ